MKSRITAKVFIFAFLIILNMLVVNINCVQSSTKLSEEEMLINELISLKEQSMDLETKLNNCDKNTINTMSANANNIKNTINQVNRSFLELKTKIKVDPFFKTMSGGFPSPNSRAWTGEAKKGKLI